MKGMKRRGKRQTKKGSINKRRNAREKEDEGKQEKE